MPPKELSRDVKSLAVPLTLSGRTTKVSSRTAKVLLLDWVVLMDAIVDSAVQTSLIRLGSVADSSCGVFCMTLVRKCARVRYAAQTTLSLLRKNTLSIQMFQGEDGIQGVVGNGCG